MSESEKKNVSTRLYIVEDVITMAPIALVRATGVVQAERYIVNKKFDVRYAEQSDLIRAVKAGLEEESALETDKSE